MAVKQGTDRLKDLPLPPDILDGTPPGTVAVNIGDGLPPAVIRPAPVNTGKGRPTDYTPALATRLIEAVRLGRTPTEVCETEDWAPHLAQFYRWRDMYPDFREGVHRARLAGAEVMADRGLDFVDKADPDSKTAILKASRQAEYRFRMAAVYDRRFSDRQIVTHEHDGAGQVADMSTKELGTIALQLQQLLTKATAIDVDSEPVEKPSSNKAITDKAKE